LDIIDNMCNIFCQITFFGVTSHYVIDQSMIGICCMKKILVCEAIQNPRISTQIVMQIIM